jgi:DNA-binding transcriptional MerR regulator
VSARSYLSIGDVLTLLRQEFPDVTISKIRFLESQGLVNPERTPSGYRKFYEHDVERLRWVLRQQREHFLPLKVIKDRLDEDAASAVPTPAAGSSTAGADAAPAVGVASDPPAVSAVEARHAATVPATAEPVLVGQVASSHRSSDAGSAAPDPSSALPGIEASGTRSAASAPAVPPVARAHRANLAAPPHRAADGAGNGAGNRSAGHPAPTASAAGDAPARRGSRGAPAPAPTDAAPAPAPMAEPDSGSAGTSGPTDSGSSIGSMGGASLSLDELCAASGLSAEYVGQLQEYGLVRASVVGGVEYFDEEALTVANVAAKLAAFGIEARHLRVYKNAVDREAGFIEQIVIPMVRQRNPEARARAGRTAEDLAALGQQLKGSLLRTALRDLLNG